MPTFKTSLAVVELLAIIEVAFCQCAELISNFNVQKFGEYHNHIFTCFPFGLV